MHTLFLASLIGFLNAHPDLLGTMVNSVGDILRKSPVKEKQLLKKRKELLEEQKQYKISEDFAKFSKLQRKINEVNSELSEINIERRSNQLAFTIALKYLSICLFGLASVVLAFYFRNDPVLILSEKFDFTPFTHFLSYPGGQLNEVSFHFWVLCTTTVFKMPSLM